MCRVRCISSYQLVHCHKGGDHTSHRSHTYNYTLTRYPTVPARHVGSLGNYPRLRAKKACPPSWPPRRCPRAPRHHLAVPTSSQGHVLHESLSWHPLITCAPTLRHRKNDSIYINKITVSRSNSLSHHISPAILSLWLLFLTLPLFIPVLVPHETPRDLFCLGSHLVPRESTRGEGRRGL